MFGFDAPTIAWIGLVSIAAFFVRGLSGFGSAMVGVGALSTVLPPVQVVPAFLALELLTTVNLLPAVWRQIDWKSLRWVIGGSLLATPLGLALLDRVPADPMRLFVSGTLLVIALLMLGGAGARWAPRRAPGAGAALAAGAASGLLNGAAGIGGPPAIVFYFAGSSVAVGRATLVTYFLVIDVYALAWAGAGGMLGRAAWPLIGVALPFSLAGLWLGSRWYARLDEVRLRRLIWGLLAVLGAGGAVAASWRLLR